MVQEAELRQQRFLKESIEEIKGLIGGLSVEQSEILHKQSMVNLRRRRKSRVKALKRGIHGDIRLDWSSLSSMVRSSRIGFGELNISLKLKVDREIIG